VSAVWPGKVVDAFPDRFEVDVNTIARIAFELEARLMPELQSNIGIDQPSN
jgi:hypothetical protein